MSDKRTESKNSQLIELEAPKHGVLLLRNNVGVAVDHTDRPVRYGLANKSPQQNKLYKSADYVGITKVVITPDMVGKTIGVFTSLEVKKSPWHYTGAGREEAQERWAQLIRDHYGIAQFTTGPEDVQWVNKS